MDSKTIEIILSYLDSSEELDYWKAMIKESSLESSVEQYVKHSTDIPSWITELKTRYVKEKELRDTIDRQKSAINRNTLIIMYSEMWGYKFGDEHKTALNLAYCKYRQQEPTIKTVKQDAHFVTVADWKKQTGCDILENGHIRFDGTPRQFFAMAKKEGFYNILPDNPTLSMNVEILTKKTGEYKLRSVDSWNKAKNPPRKRTKKQSI